MEKLQILIEKVLRTEKISTDWKQRIMLTVFKQGDKRTSENYGGITL